MLHLRLNVRLAALGVAIAALALLGGALATSPRSAEAVDIDDPEGVFCIQLSGLATGIGLVRIESPTATTVTFTSQVYIQDTQPLPDCQDPVQDPIPSDATPFPDLAGDRPTLAGTWDDSNDTLIAEVCQPNFEFGPLLWPFGKVSVDFALSKPPDKSSGTFTLEGPFNNAFCTGGTPSSFDVNVTGARYLDGPNADPATFDSDWDKDGVRDWDELQPGLGACYDPFTAKTCVGGIAELPGAATAPLQAAGGSGPDAGLIAAIAAGATGLALGAAWYARRRVARQRAG